MSNELLGSETTTETTKQQVTGYRPVSMYSQDAGPVELHEQEPLVTASAAEEEHLRGLGWLSVSEITEKLRLQEAAELERQRLAAEKAAQEAAKQAQAEEAERKRLAELAKKQAAERAAKEAEKAALIRRQIFEAEKINVVKRPLEQKLGKLRQAYANAEQNLAGAASAGEIGEAALEKLHQLNAEMAEVQARLAEPEAK